MSLSNKSLEKSKRFVGVKANDFVAKNRTTDTNRSNVRPQGWANLGKINSRRIPPPANVPSLKSESGSQPSVYDPTVPSNHGWTSNSSPDIAPSQQQLDAFPLQSSAPSTPIVSSTENEKIRPQTSWSSVTAASTNPEPIPNLLALNDFPRLATTQDRRSSPNENNPSFRPTNLSSWKDGGSRIQPLMSDAPVQLMSPSNLRQYSPQSMWAQPVPSSRLNNVTEYKTPTILRNKDIDDLSKLTENSWANASEEINYEEKIRFSDEEDPTDLAAVPLPNSNKSRRLIQEDEHFRQMQDEKNSELINALSIAKQRRDEQERHLKKHSHDEQEEFPRRANEGSRTRHDTANSQTFSMKSWSEQMDSFNYASLHDKSENKNETKEFPRSTSDSSSPTPQEKTKKVKTRLIQSRTYPKNDSKVRPVDPPSTKGKSNRNAQQWSPHSPTPRASDSAEHPTRYPIDTSSIPPLMSVCSDPTSTAHLFENSHSTGPYAQPYSYTTLGSYGRYRRGGNAAAAAPTHRPQGQNDYSSYSSPIPTKKNGHQSKSLIEEGKISPLMSKSIDFPLEPMKKSSDVDSNENSTKTKMTNGKQRRNQREPLAFYQAPRHRNNYPQAMATHSSSAVDRNFSSEYESVPTQHYYNHSRRNAPMQHEFYEHPQQQHYNNYSKGESSGTTRISTKKPSKRSSATTKTRFNNGNHSNPRAHSTSDNDPKEGEEWETASESSTNLRNGHEENAHSSNKGDHRGRTPPKKNFTQRPHTRQIFKYTNA